MGTNANMSIRRKVSLFSKSSTSVTEEECVPILRVDKCTNNSGYGQCLLKCSECWMKCGWLLSLNAFYCLPLMQLYSLMKDVDHCFSLYHLQQFYQVIRILWYVVHHTTCIYFTDFITGPYFPCLLVLVSGKYCPGDHHRTAGKYTGLMHIPIYICTALIRAHSNEYVSPGSFYTGQIIV